MLGFIDNIKHVCQDLMSDIRSQIIKASNGLEMFKQYCSRRNCQGFVESNSKKPIGKCSVCEYN